VCQEPGAHLIGNLRTIKHLQNIIYISSEVGIPILKSQTDAIIDMGHGHQSYTVDLCEKFQIKTTQDDIATRHTQWFYVSQIIHTPSQPGLQRYYPGSSILSPKVRI
jgi:hypothetical protein